MSIAVPVIILVLLSAQVYDTWPQYLSEQKDKTEQADNDSSKDKSEKTDESSPKKAKPGKVRKSSSAMASGTRYERMRRLE